MPAAKETLKEVIVKNAKMVVAIAIGVFTLIGTIGGGVLYVDNNFAHAADVQQLLKNQNTQIDLYKKHQQQNLVFQLEYYDDRIKALTAEKSRSHFIMNDPNIPATAKAHVRRPEDIQSEINDLKVRREIIRRSLSGGN